MDWMGSRAQRVTKTMRQMLRTRPALVVGLVALVGLTPAAATALRLRSSSSILRAQRPGRSAQGEPGSVVKPTAVKANRGNLPKPAAVSKPTVLHLTKAHSAVFDVRTLRGKVVRKE